MKCIPMLVIVCTLGSSIVCCGRYSPQEVMDTYDAYESGVQEVDATPIETWATESEDALNNVLEDLHEASEMLEDISQQIEYWNTLPDQEALNAIVMYWSDNQPQFESWMDNFTGMK